MLGPTGSARLDLPVPDVPTGMNKDTHTHTFKEEDSLRRRRMRRNSMVTFSLEEEERLSAASIVLIHLLFIYSIVLIYYSTILISLSSCIYINIFCYFFYSDRLSFICSSYVILLYDYMIQFLLF